MNNYCTKLSFTPSGLVLGFGDATSAPTSAPLESFDWSYHFEDGSRIVGQVKGYLGDDGNTLFNPTDMSATYLGTDGETILLKWENDDFCAFESTIDGTKSVIVASNDNCVSNSMCLVSCASRSCAQITHWGIQLEGESFGQNSWSISPKLIPKAVSQPQVSWDWTFYPVYPFVALSFNFFNFSVLRETKSYSWTFYPYFPFYPVLKVKR